MTTRSLGWVTTIALLGCGSQPRPTLPEPSRPTIVAQQAPVCAGSGAHGKHTAAGLDCATCHPCGGQSGFTNVYTYPGGTSTLGGTLTGSSAATPATCTVACHSPLGGPQHTVAWNAPGPLACIACHDKAAFAAPHPDVSALSTRADCEACHDVSAHTAGRVRLVSHPASWMAQADPGFHAFGAERGLAACQQCHLPDLSGGATGTSCASCHDKTDPSGALVSWKTNCTLCHGGSDDSSGAPPRTIWGLAADPVRVGAHRSHLAGSALAPPFACETCHVKPADALAVGHIDEVPQGAVPTATVAFGGLGARGTPSWDRATATCSSTYCHGATLTGGSNPAPVWTRVGQGQAVCGTCHGAPPPPPHPPAAGLTACSGCHPRTMDASGAVIPPQAGGLHLDGTIESTGGHAASWTDPASPDFHAFSANRGLQVCAGCHGADLAGGTAGVSCAQCHDQGLPPGVSSWKQNCTMCHGGTDNQSGAPPRATWGNSADALRVGAHSAHMSGGGITAPLGCDACHLKPADALAPGHIDAPTASLTWGAQAIRGGAAPAWDRATGTCAATYCHGNYSGTYSYIAWDYGNDVPVPVSVPYSGARATPSWTGGAATCASCHGNPPRNGNWHSGAHGGGDQCQLCHADAVGTAAGGTAITDPARHLNGTVDVDVVWKSSCLGCH